MCQRFKGPPRNRHACQRVGAPDKPFEFLAAMDALVTSPVCVCKHTARGASAEHKLSLSWFAVLSAAVRRSRGAPIRWRHARDRVAAPHARPRASRAPPARMPPDLGGRGRFARRAHKSQIAKSKRPAGIGRGIVRPSFALAVPPRGARAGSPGKGGGSGSEKNADRRVGDHQSVSCEGRRAKATARARGGRGGAARGKGRRARGRGGRRVPGGAPCRGEGGAHQRCPRAGAGASGRRGAQCAEYEAGFVCALLLRAGPTKKKKKRVGEPERGGNDAGSHSGAPAAAQLAAPTPSRHGSALARARKSRTAARGRAVRRRAKWSPCLRSG